MEPLLIVVLLVVFLAFPLWAIARIIELGRSNDRLNRWQLQLEAQLSGLRDELARLRPASPASIPPTAAPPAPPVTSAAQIPPAPAVQEPITPRETILPPQLDAIVTPAIAAATPAATTGAPVESAHPLPPPLSPPVPREASPSPDLLADATPPPSLPTPRLNWEEFMGAKLFAWLGALAAFLGAVFFIRYSFEHDLISPAFRIALGFAFGIALVIGGLKVPRKRYGVTAQSLIAAGVVSLYAVTFASNSVYGLLNAAQAFTVMSLITAGAFVLAAKLDARVIAVLGMAGGFLTPVVLSTGKDNAAELFGYIALLDIGLLAVALHRRWFFLAPLGAVGTILMQVGWAGNFLTAAKAPVAMVVSLGFSALFLAAQFVSRQTDRRSSQIAWSAIALPIIALAFAGVFVAFPSVASRPVLWFGFVILADACLLAVAWSDAAASRIHLVSGSLVFLLLALWTAVRLTNDRLWWALGMYLVFAVVHTAFSLLLDRRRPGVSSAWLGHAFPALSLVLVLGPLLKLETVTFGIWPVILLIDLVAFATAIVAASLLGILLAFVLTLIATGIWMFRLPTSEPAPMGFLLILGGFVMVFFAGTTLLSRRLEQAAGAQPGPFPRRAQLPALSALLPFALLIMAAERLSFPNPTPLFTSAWVLDALTLGLSAALLLEWLPACALFGTVLLEAAWRATQAPSAVPGTQLFWFVLLGACFAAFPFLFRRRFAALTGPWVIAAVGWAAQYAFVYPLVRATWPHLAPGLIPAAFAVPPLVSLFLIARDPSHAGKARLNQLAWFGGTGLLFITAMVGVQFEREGITIGWALEGAALLWLFHRVPHPGLRATGVALLVVAFARLALNPAVLEYHVRGPHGILNWYLYAYGIVTLALFASARLLLPPQNVLAGFRVPPLLNTLGTILAFLLLNIEIADFFTTPGSSVLTFRFSGNFARDMAYTIGWSLFALALLLISIQRRLRPGRYAALALLGAAVLKLFFHDLARLDSLYRIGALFGVAIVAILASVAYQRFLARDRTEQ